MTPKRFFIVMCVVNLILVLAIITGVYFGNSLISKQANKLSLAKAKNEATQALKDQLNQAKKDIAQYEDLNQITKSIVPQDKDQAKTVLEIQKAAMESGIPIKSIVFDTSSLGQVKKATTSSNEDGSGATTKAPTTDITQVAPVQGINGVYSLKITVSSQDATPVNFSNLITFLQKLENNRRTAHVEDISIKPSPEGKVSFNLILKAYLKP